jgi:hypothetical protein
VTCQGKCNKPAAQNIKETRAPSPAKSQILHPPHGPYSAEFATPLQLNFAT